MFGRYSLKKSRKVLHEAVNWYNKQGYTLPEQERKQLENELEAFDNALLAKDRKAAELFAKRFERERSHQLLKESIKHTLNVVAALLLALALAVVVRQSWWELYKIPTGSMRPTYEEEYYLAVSKTPFSLNVPLATKHLIFEPENVKRGNAVIWSGDGLNLPDVDTRFFWIFPYKKRYIKRLIGKPGDTLYFYGGEVWGIDRDGKPIDELRTLPWMQERDYVPFMSFDGRSEFKKPSSASFSKQVQISFFGNPVAKVESNWAGMLSGELQTEEGWKPETNALHYYNFFGIENYAMAELVTKEEVERRFPNRKEEVKDELALLLYHHPTLAKGAQKEIFKIEVSILPLNKAAELQLFNNLYTGRFNVEEEVAYPYPYGKKETRGVPLRGVPAGTYEFEAGKAYQIGLTGIRSELPDTHPLLAKTKERALTLFNFGIGFSPRRFELPIRFATFRDGDLYLMGKLFLKKEDPTLTAFNEKEKKAEPIGFVDTGVPTAETILKWGVKVPEGNYLVLGDNHANSLDSRYFGFVPAANLQGQPLFVFWPPGKGFGMPEATSTPLLTPQNLIMWAFALIALTIYWYFQQKKMKSPLFKKRA